MVAGHATAAGGPDGSGVGAAIGTVCDAVTDVEVSEFCGAGALAPPPPPHPARHTVEAAATTRNFLNNRKEPFCRAIFRPPDGKVG